jgi:hypothetical protein
VFGRWFSANAHKKFCEICEQALDARLPAFSVRIVAAGAAVQICSILQRRFSVHALAVRNVARVRRVVLDKPARLALDGSIPRIVVLGDGCFLLTAAFAFHVFAYFCRGSGR